MFYCKFAFCRAEAFWTPPPRPWSVDISRDAVLLQGGQEECGRQAAHFLYHSWKVLRNYGTYKNPMKLASIVSSTTALAYGLSKYLAKDANIVTLLMTDQLCRQPDQQCNQLCYTVGYTVGPAERRSTVWCPTNHAAVWCSAA